MNEHQSPDPSRKTGGLHDDAHPENREKHSFPGMKYPLISEESFLSSVSERNAFYLKVLHDLIRETSFLTDISEILETFLLTASGPLGVSSGYIVFADKNPEKADLFSRGVSAEEKDLLASSLKQLSNDFFSGPSAFSRLIYRYEQQKDIPPYLPRSTRLLATWTLDSGQYGLLALGRPIIEKRFSDDDARFVLILVDGLTGVLRNAIFFRDSRILNTELSTKNNELTGLLEETRQTREALDRRVYHLKTLYDASVELSATGGEGKLGETFLLILMGTFSAASGCVVILDMRRGEFSHFIRGAGDEELRKLDFEQVQNIVFNSIISSDITNFAPMSTSFISNVVWHGESNPPFRICSAFAFALDETCLGMVLLSEKLLGCEYSQEEKDLMQTHISSFIVFLKNARSFETIKRLNSDLERRNSELLKTIEDLTQAKKRIEILEAAKAGIKALIQREIGSRHKPVKADFAFIIVIGIILGLLFNYSAPSRISIIPANWLRPPIQTIGVADAEKSLTSGEAIIIDARPAEFYKVGHIADALNVPAALFDFVYMMKLSDIDLEKRIIVYGRTVSRLYDDDVAAKLKARGHENVMILGGGIDEWEKTVPQRSNRQ